MRRTFGLIGVLGAAFFLFIWFYLPSISKYHELKVKQEELDLQIAKLKADIESVQEERDLLRNDVEYLEKTIREELGLVKPGEIVYKFVEENPQTGVSVNSVEKIAHETGNVLPQTLPAIPDNAAAQPAKSAVPGDRA